MEDRITVDDVEEYSFLFTLAPSFILERFARRNSNVVAKFRSTIQGQFDNLNSEQRHKLDLILASDVGELQAIMNEAYLKTGIKQYGILANPKYGGFIEGNIDEIRKMVKK